MAPASVRRKQGSSGFPPPALRVVKQMLSRTLRTPIPRSRALSIPRQMKQKDRLTVRNSVSSRCSSIFSSPLLSLNLSPSLQEYRWKMRIMVSMAISSWVGMPAGSGGGYSRSRTPSQGKALAPRKQMRTHQLFCENRIHQRLFLNCNDGPRNVVFRPF